MSALEEFRLRRLDARLQLAVGAVEDFASGAIDERTMKKAACALAEILGEVTDGGEQRLSGTPQVPRPGVVV
jgi:hypothetical protein